MLAWLPALLLAANTTAADPKAPKCVQIIGTNDLHGHIEPDIHRAKPPPPEPKLPSADPNAKPPEPVVQKPIEVQAGGLADFAAYLDILRAKYPKQTLLLDGGDLFQGTVPSNLSKGAAVIAAYNALGYQAAALGNHEFDFGPEKTEQDLLGAIKKRLGEAHFPFLACNIYEAKSGKRPTWKNLKPSALVTVNGIKVGVIGAITPDTPTVTVPLNVASLEFRNPADDVKREAAALRKQGAKVVVLVAHIGGDCAKIEDPHDNSSCNAHSELWALLDALPEGTLDVAIAGHTHKYIAQFVKGVAVSEAGSYGASFGWVEACVDSAGKVTTNIHPPVDVCMQDWTEGGCRVRENSAGETDARFLDEKLVADPKIEKALSPFLAAVKAQQEAPIGVTMATPLTRKHDAPSPLGVLVAEAIRAAVPGADLGLTNAGGVRADLPGGSLKFGQLFEVLPFDNRVVGIKLTGKQLEALLTAPLEAGHGFPQLSGGKLDFDRAHPDAAKVTLADGSAIDPAKTYVLATNDFLANGGDGTKAVMDGVGKKNVTETGKLVRDAFLTFLKAQPQPVPPPKVPDAK